MSLYENVVAVPDQVFDALSVAQEGVLTAISALAESVKPFTAKLPDAPFGDQVPNAIAIVESAFGTAERLLANQKNFTIKLIEAYRQPVAAPKSTSKPAKAA